MEPYDCQIRIIPHVSEGDAPLPHLTLGLRVKLFLKRKFSADTKKALKRYSVAFVRKFRAFEPASSVPVSTVAQVAADFEAGDKVRVRSVEEIQATLNMYGELKGCRFMPEMRRYCGTTQTVLKPVRRFVDERDYQVKRCRSLILLERVICEGTAEYGPCDRSCFYFWRTEWLEKLN